jgi:hypothetical protein
LPRHVIAFLRHSGLDPESMNIGPGDLSKPVFMDPDFRQDDGFGGD